MNFNFSAVNVNEGPKRVVPGIHKLTIGNLEFDPNNNSAILTLLDQKTGLSHREYMSFKEKAAEYSQIKLKHIGTKVLKEEDFNKLTTIEQVNAVLVGQTLRFKLSGRETEKDGKVYINAQLGFPPFCESLDVSDEDSKLTYDENNKYDFAKLPEKPTSNHSLGSLALGE
jgi:hypothetical protein